MMIYQKKLYSLALSGMLLALGLSGSFQLKAIQDVILEIISHDYVGVSFSSIIRKYKTSPYPFVTLHVANIQELDEQLKAISVKEYCIKEIIFFAHGNNSAANYEDPFGDHRIIGPLISLNNKNPITNNTVDKIFFGLHDKTPAPYQFLKEYLPPNYYEECEKPLFFHVQHLFAQNIKVYLISCSILDNIYDDRAIVRSHSQNLINFFRITNGTLITSSKAINLSSFLNKSEINWVLSYVHSKFSQYPFLSMATYPLLRLPYISLLMQQNYFKEYFSKLMRYLENPTLHSCFLPELFWLRDLIPLYKRDLTARGFDHRKTILVHTALSLILPFFYYSDKIVELFDVLRKERPVKDLLKSDGYRISVEMGTVDNIKAVNMYDEFEKWF